MHSFQLGISELPGIARNMALIQFEKAIDNMFGIIPDNSGMPDIWEDREFAEAPYTAEAARHKKAPYLGSTMFNDVDVDPDAEFLPIESLNEIAGRKDDRGLSNFLDSMMSVRSRGSARR